MKDIGTENDGLIEVLGKYPPVQMNQIIKGYKSNYGKVHYFKYKMNYKYKEYIININKT